MATTIHKEYTSSNYSYFAQKLKYPISFIIKSTKNFSKLEWTFHFPNAKLLKIWTDIFVSKSSLNTLLNSNCENWCFVILFILLKSLFILFNVSYYSHISWKTTQHISDFFGLLMFHTFLRTGKTSIHNIKFVKKKTWFKPFSYHL